MLIVARFWSEDNYIKYIMHFNKTIQYVPSQYLRKQSAALREVNDSRLRIYENLEVSINDIEKSNNRLTAESNNQKKTIKT